MKKVCHITTVHPANDTRIFHKECISLSQSGFKVYLIAPGITDQVRSGIHLLAIQKSEKRFKRIFISQYQALRKALQVKADLYHFHDPELIPLGLVLKISGKKIIYDVHEDVPKQVLNKHWIPKIFAYPISKIWDYIDRFAAFFVDSIVTVTPHIAKRFPSNKTSIVRNFPIIKTSSPDESPLLTNDSNSFIYVGSIDKTRGVEEMIKALYLVNKTRSEPVFLTLIGKFSSNALQQKLKKMPGWKFVNYMGWQDYSVLQKYYQLSLAGIALLHPTPSYIEGYPVKLFEYMLNGLPIIASNFPVWRDLVEEAECCCFINPLDIEAVVEKMIWLLDNKKQARKMGNQGRNTIYTKLNWNNEFNNLKTTYMNILGKTSRRDESINE